MEPSIKDKLSITYVSVDLLREAEHNARKDTVQIRKKINDSIDRHGIVDAIIVNRAPGRENIVIGGSRRLAVAKSMGYKEVPVIYLNIPDIEKEKDLCLRLNKAVGEWDLDLLAQFDETFLADVGFDSEELDEIFPAEENPTPFVLEEELKKIGINGVTVQKGDLYDLDGSRLFVGDSTVEADMLALMGDERADMCLTDEPYVLDYARGKKRHGKPTEGFGYKRDRKYLETDSIPDDFIEKWTANVAKVAKPDFSILAYEHPKNLRLLWNEMEKHWRYRSTVIWHIPNRVQGYSAKYKFYNKFDIATLFTGGDVELNVEPEEDELIQNEYEAALFMTSGKPHWESPEKGKKYVPTDFIEHVAADEKSSGQGIIFGTKPLPILIPYIKVLTKRGDLILEPFGGSGSTLVAANTLGRRCFLMEKVPTYAEVILNRWEKFSGKKRVKIHGPQQ